MILQDALLVLLFLLGAAGMAYLFCPREEPWQIDDEDVDITPNLIYFKGEKR